MLVITIAMAVSSMWIFFFLKFKKEETRKDRIKLFHSIKAGLICVVRIHGVIHSGQILKTNNIRQEAEILTTDEKFPRKLIVKFADFERVGKSRVK